MRPLSTPLHAQVANVTLVASLKRRCRELKDTVEALADEIQILRENAPSRVR